MRDNWFNNRNGRRTKVGMGSDESPAPSLPAPDSMGVTIVEDGWGTLKDPETGSPGVVRRYTLTGPSGFCVQLVSYGAAVVRIRAPDKRGVLHDVLLCADNLHDYIKHRKHVGNGVRGRVANRIWRGRFRLDGAPVFVSRNEGQHYCDGGFFGFDKVLWHSRVVDGRVVMTHLSGDGDEGFRGAVLVILVFRLTADDILVVDAQARADRATPLDLRYGLFLNLAGHETGEKGILEHSLTLNSTKYFAPTDDNHASDHILDARGTRFDFLEGHSLGDRLHKIPRGGYDHTFCINVYPPGELSFAARLEHAGSGRVVEVYSDQPTLHVYTGRYLPEASWQIERALPMPHHEPKLRHTTYDAWPWPEPFVSQRLKSTSMVESQESEEPLMLPIKKSSTSVWSAATCSVILSSSSGSSCDWPIAKPRNRWDKATSTTSLARVIEAATSTHLSLRDQATSITPIKPPPLFDLLGRCKIQRPQATPPDPDVVEAEMQNELEERWVEEDEQWKYEESVWAEPELQQRGIPGRNGELYYRFGGIELATQGFPDAVNNGHFPSCILRPGEFYTRTTIYYFSNLPKTEAELKEEIEREGETEARGREAEEAILDAEVRKKFEEALVDIPEESEEE